MHDFRYYDMINTLFTSVLIANETSASTAPVRKRTLRSMREAATLNMTQAVLEDLRLI